MVLGEDPAEVHTSSNRRGVGGEVVVPSRWIHETRSRNLGAVEVAGNCEIRVGSVAVRDSVDGAVFGVGIDDFAVGLALGVGPDRVAHPLVAHEEVVSDREGLLELGFAEDVEAAAAVGSTVDGVVQDLGRIVGAPHTNEGHEGDTGADNHVVVEKQRAGVSPDDLKGVVDFTASFRFNPVGVDFPDGARIQLDPGDVAVALEHGVVSDHVVVDVHPFRSRAHLNAVATGVLHPVVGDLHAA